MTDDRVETFVQTEEGELAFQEYFVREGTHPAVRGVRFAGIEAADPSEVLLGSIREVELIVIAPSNPVASIEPILALPGVREQLQRSRALRVAVSPIIGGRALKGPTVQFLEAVGVEATAVGIAGHYRDVLDTLVVDRMDAGAESEIRRLGLDVIVGDTVMRTGEDRVRVARLALSSLWPSEQ
jgi:LPPG:FO 2-phospho-L-lactate transferase